MTVEEKKLLLDLLDKLLATKCGIERGIYLTCSTDCPFTINGAYGDECAIEVVSDVVSNDLNK